MYISKNLQNNINTHCQPCRENSKLLIFKISVYVHILLKPNTQQVCYANFQTRHSVIMGIGCNIVCFCRLPKVSSDLSAKELIGSYNCRHKVDLKSIFFMKR